eukprot:Em0018g330a
MSVYCSFAVAVTLAVLSLGTAQSAIPYSSPYQCPSPKLSTKNCSICAEGELCCNSVCTKAVLPARPCDVVVASSYPSRLGAYVPQCSADGKFNPVQNWGSTGSSWCVDTSNGKPLSAVAAPRGQKPNCTVCTEGGKTYYPGQSFTASDGCNTCSCSSTGVALCTLKACNIVIPAYSSPYECPSPKLLTKNCSTCAEGELCCNSVCTKAVLPARPCDVVVASNYPSRLGAYVPQCSADGNSTQCRSGGPRAPAGAWTPQNGKAVSEAVPRGQQPNCITCTVSGKKYYPGQSFPASDGCNTCSCSTKGTAVCTLKDCRVAFTIPYRSPYQCPPEQVSSDNCSTCAQNELCCDSECTTAVLPSRPCDSVSGASPSLIGAYVPQCSADGNFNPVQSWGSTGYSWCVNTASGKPLSTVAAPRGQLPNCAVCTVSGKKYYPGQSFPASDGCNTCFCSNNGLAACTKKACVACPVTGQVFTECGSACSSTCDKPVSFCVLSCVAKCQCPSGQVVDTKNNKCVEQVDCPIPASAAPYISPYQCPSQTRLTKNNCSSCSSADELCCNSACTKGVLPAKPCTLVASQGSGLRVGAYVPQCVSDGTFAPIQSQGSTGYSWCVDISDGKPLSVPVGPGRKPNCTVCAVSGRTYYPGQSYVAPDGCNTCSCTQTGASVCTQRTCVVCPVKGQTYTTCGSSCDATCANPTPICTTHCVSKCQCPSGTVLDTSSNKCVSPKSCPNRNV